MKSKTCHLAAWAALALAVAASDLSAQALRTVDAGGGLYLTQVGGRALLREPSGAAGELPLPPGVEPRRLVALDGGWLLAGEIEAPGISDLFLLRSRDGLRSSFPAPADPAGEALRGGPLPLVEGGRLAGLAWLAGAGVRETAVWAAAWSGLDWAQPELVSPVGPGTQIAIDGAVLADGSWLLVWAAYDGQDDEILWSRRVAGRWSPPAVLHAPNDVPDVMPSLLATGRGALVAWNGFDGSLYRVRLAAFEDGAWRELDLDAPPAVRPGLTRAGDGALLLYRTVVPPGWVLDELDARGNTLRRAVVETQSTLRPGVLLLDGSGAGLEWPGDRAGAVRRLEAQWRAVP